MHIIKRKGHRQEFDERKLYASIFAACKTVHVLDEEAENIANLVTREIKKWLDGKEEITSHELSIQTTRELEHLNKEAAFLYSTHKDVC